MLLYGKIKLVKKTKSKPKLKTKRIAPKNTFPKRTTFVLFWTLFLLLLSIPIILFLKTNQDIRERAAGRQLTTQAAACIPSGGTCKPVGGCGSAETDSGQKDCSSDGSLTCCVPKSVGCLGSCSTPTSNPIAPSPVIPTDTPIFNGFPGGNVSPQPAISSMPTDTPMPSTVVPSISSIPTDTPMISSAVPSQAIPNPSQAAPSSVPSGVQPSTDPGNGDVGNNLLSELLNLIKKLLDLLKSLINGIGGHHSGGNGGNHSGGDKDKD